MEELIRELNTTIIAPQAKEAVIRRLRARAQARLSSGEESKIVPIDEATNTGAGAGATT